MYQIGLFSKMNRITAKTLRHYDVIGLLKPEHVDDFTGYRYYSAEQIPRLYKIIALKQMGLSLNEIKDIIEEPINIEVLLKTKQNELVSALKETKKQLTQVQSYLDRIEGDLSMKYNPIIKSLPEVVVASMRFMADSYDTYFDVIPKMGDEMRKAGAICASPAYCFNIYHDEEYREKDIDVETCEAVVEVCKDSETVKYKTISGVSEALCIVHKGPYAFLRDAYIFAFQWIKDNGYEVIGKVRESYIDGIWNQDDEENWLTEVQIPISTK